MATKTPIVAVPGAEPSKPNKSIKITKDSQNHTNEWLVNSFNVALAWTDVNLLPIFCLAILCAFAVIGFSTRLNNMTEVQKVVLSVAIVALLAVKTGRKVTNK